jgi:hypothetical protein
VLIVPGRTLLFVDRAAAQLTANYLTRYDDRQLVYEINLSRIFMSSKAALDDLPIVAG